VGVARGHSRVNNFVSDLRRTALLKCPLMFS
jgi:hypothetical protein